MREILFRAKRKDTGEWVEGFYFESFTEIPYIMTLHDHILGMTEFYEVDPATVGQFTGLLDKNGKRIFEGDIVKAHDAYKQYSEPNHEFTGAVEFDNASFLINQDDCVKHYRWMDYECEVISTIHDKGVSA
jgi:uncharacterized phage protein (TIGR01671 family)